MSAKKKTVDVTIMGRSYKIACGDEERDALLAAVSLLDSKMNEIKAAGKVASAERIAIMAALNLAHDLLQPKESSSSGSSSVDLEGMRGRMHSMQLVLEQALAPQERLL
jgi:cell division protein ZapA